MIVDIYTTDKKYNVIYADPPWKYKTWTEGGGTAEKHYPTMKLDDIIKMKDTIEKISDNNCILFLWVTFPCLLEGLKVMKELATTGLTMIIVTHEMAFARDVSTRTIFMDQGYVAEDAPPKKLFTTPKNPRTREFLSRYLAG